VRVLEITQTYTAPLPPSTAQPAPYWGALCSLHSLHRTGELCVAFTACTVLWSLHSLGRAMESCAVEERGCVGAYSHDIDSAVLHRLHRLCSPAQATQTLQPCTGSAGCTGCTGCTVLYSLRHHHPIGLGQQGVLTFEFIGVTLEPCTQHTGATSCGTTSN